LNLNIGGVNEIKSPILKNSSKNNNNFNPSNLQNSQSQSNAAPNNFSRYTSLIDSQNYAQNSSRPSSAIIIKGRHNRENSSTSLKNDQINCIVNLNSPLARSPSSQSIVNHLNRNYSRQILRKETPRGNYLSNIDTSKNANTPAKGIRPSTTQEKLRINYNNLNYINNNQVPNINTLSQIKTSNRYEAEEILNKRGYSLSSRAIDLRPGSYRLKENEKFQASSK
jgi:hypothetical protein